MIINCYKKFKELFASIYLKSSFSLIETAVVLAVTGIIIGSGLIAYKGTNPKIKNDLKKIKAIEDALQQFFTMNGRLPYPAYPNFSSDNANYLIEYSNDVYNYSKQKYYCNENDHGDGDQSFSYCNSGDNSNCCPNNFVLWGVVPTRTLGLPDDYAYDSYGHNFEYITHSALAYFNGKQFSTEHKKTSYVVDYNGKYAVNFKHSEKDDIIIPIERLSIFSNINNKELITTKDNTAYVIISKEQTDGCYFDTKTGIIDTSKIVDDTAKNCVQTYINHPEMDRTIYNGYSNEFNNIVKYKTISELIQKNSNIKEDTRILTNRNNFVEYQLKTDDRLTTNSKEVIGAINELTGMYEQINSIFKIVSTFEDVAGDSAVLYFLTTAYDNYNRGIYVYQDKKFICLSEITKSICEQTYPVGSIYVTTDKNLSTKNSVKEKLGCGNWERMECGVMLQNAGETEGSFCGTAGGYRATAWDGKGVFSYRELPVNYVFQCGAPEIEGSVYFNTDSTAIAKPEITASKAFIGSVKTYGYGAQQLVTEYTEKYRGFDFKASKSDSVYGNAGRSTIQPFTYTVYMWKRIS